MNSGFQVICANKNMNGSIVRIGGDGWSMEIHDAILKMLTGQLRLTILIGNNRFDIGIRGEGTHAFLALEPDGKPLHEVDGLQSC